MSGPDILPRIARQAMQDRGLLPDFSPEAERQAAALRPLEAPPMPPRAPVPPILPAAPIQATQATPPARAEVRDLRGLLWSSIDNDDSRGLDQIEVVEPTAGGAARVLIGIADVDALVPRGSPIDVHARHNTTSVYTAARVFPMLPERLSTDLSSLAEDADRLAIVIELAVGAEGAVEGAAVYRAWVRNHAKLAYASVGAWLEAGGAAPPRTGERFAAIVTGVTDEGAWVRIERPAAEGKPIRGFKGLDVGDRIEVELTQTDVERGFVDFARSM